MGTASEHRDDPDWDSIDGVMLIAGDAADAGSSQASPDGSPRRIGVIVIEADAGIPPHLVDAPAGVSVRWLVRGDGTRDHALGERLATAVHSWCVEWTCSEPPERWTVWLGPHTPPHVARMARSLLGVAS